MPRRTALLDTSFIIALENKDDPHHLRAKALDEELLRDNALLILHWGIVLEIADGYARLGRRARGLQLLGQFESEDGYQVLPITEPLFLAALELYRNRDALTADSHFRQAGFTALLLEDE